MLFPVFIYTLIFCIGFVIVNSISTRLNIGEKIGLSFPFGFGLLTFLMLALNSLKVAFDLGILIGSSVVLAIFIGVFILRKRKLIEIININRKALHHLKQLNLSWLFLFGILVYIVYGISVKALFWPTAAYDSVTGYDYMAKVVAAEGTFNNSIFDEVNPTSSIRHSYPPFVPGSFSVAYMTGLQSSKILVVLIFLSLIIYFWAVVKKYTTQTSAICFTLILTCVPEYLAMSALSLSNVPQTLFASAGLIALSEYISKREKEYLLLGSLLLSLNAWTRSDGIVFIIGGGIMLLSDCINRKKLNLAKYWKQLLVYSAISLIPFLSWHIYMKIHVKNSYSNSDALIKHLFWDADKFSELIGLIWGIVSNTRLYGIVFILFAIVFLLNIRNLHKDKPILLIGIFFSFFLYAFLYYQMNNEGERFGYSLESMINASFKRGMFPFLPAICFYMASSSMVLRFFHWIFKPLIK